MGCTHPTLMQHVDVKVHEGVGTILIGRRERRGAIDPVLIEDLDTALGDLHLENRVRAVVIAGAGDYFSSGWDTDMVRRIAAVEPPDDAAQWMRIWQRWVELLEAVLRFPKPVIAAVDGPAIGAGLALACAADVVVASDSAAFAAPATRMGLVGGVTATLMVFRVGAAGAARWCLTGEPFDARSAAAMGLCDPPVPSDQIWVAGQTIGRSIAESTPESVALTKRAINEVVAEDLYAHLHSAAASAATLAVTDAGRERLG